MTASNVVRLPTAARRKVQQRYNRHFREAAREMRKEWPGEYISPHVREKLPEAAALLQLERTPELLLVLAIFQALSPEQQQQVRADCEMMKYTGAAARAANAAIQIRTIGESFDLHAAMERLRRVTQEG